jgi:hypothetical protein
MDEEVIRNLMLEEDEGVIRKKQEDSRTYFKDLEENQDNEEQVENEIIIEDKKAVEKEVIRNLMLQILA